jgi:hypothetical protein
MARKKVVDHLIEPLAQSGAKSPPAAIVPAAAGADGRAVHRGSEQASDTQTHVAAAAPEVSPSTGVGSPTGVALVHGDVGTSSASAVMPAGLAHGPRNSAAKAVRPAVGGAATEEAGAKDGDDEPAVQGQLLVFQPAFAKSVVEVPDAGKP